MRLFNREKNSVADKTISYDEYDEERADVLKNLLVKTAKEGTMGILS
jgi:hypothetical protein